MVIRSPAFMGPFSVEILRGTRPERARGTLKLELKVLLSEPPRVSPGLVETMPMTAEVEVALMTNSVLLVSTAAISPASMVSLVG